MGPGATNNLEHFSTEEFQIICTLEIIGHLAISDNPESSYSWDTAPTNWGGRGPWALPKTGTGVDGGLRGYK